MSDKLQKDVPIFIQILNNMIKNHPTVLDRLLSEDDMKSLIFESIDNLGITQEDLKKEKVKQTATFIQVPPELNVSNMDNFIELIQNVLGGTKKENKSEDNSTTNGSVDNSAKNKEEINKEEINEEAIEEDNEEEIVEPHIIYPNRAFNFIENTPKKAENGMYNPIYMFEDTVITQYSMLIISYLNIKRKDAIQALFNHIEKETLSRFNMKLTMDSLNPEKFVKAIQLSVFYPKQSYADTPLNEVINEFLLENSYDVSVSEFMEFVKAKENSSISTYTELPPSIQLSELAYLDLGRFDEVLFS